MAPHAINDTINGTFGSHTSEATPPDDCYTWPEHPPWNSTPDKGTSQDDCGIEPIAVIGFSFRFPEKATSGEGFWNMLTQKRCCMTEFPKDRTNVEALYHPDPKRLDTISHRGGHFLEGELGNFDAPFFSIGAAEATAMDPQHRLLLETTFRALENAGISMEKASGSKTSVYTGCFTDGYRVTTVRDLENLPAHSGIGVTNAMLAARISWFFNLQGTCLNLDTACSSGMMALHLAFQELVNGDSRMALVGSSNLIDEHTGLCLSNLTFLSQDSRCFSFDDRANGYGRGEGVSVIVLKRLSDALEDGDTIRAVLRSTGSNQDGRTPGITQPSEAAQELLIRQTYQKAKLDMGLTGYVEAHGTGTMLGDPIEANAIGEAFRGTHSEKDPIFIGAVKSNIGHLESASGMASIIKTILVLETGVIPPNANFENLNPAISAEDLRLVFPTKVTPWPSERLRRASVSSFGFGGSNVHAVFDDAYNYLRLNNLVGNHCTARQPVPAQYLAKSYTSLAKLRVLNIETWIATDRSLRDWRPKLLIWSAADAKGISRLGKAYAVHLAQLSACMSDRELVAYATLMAYNLSSRRSALPWRSALVACSPLDLQDITKRITQPIRSKTGLNVGYIFTGQGAQYVGMAKELFELPVFKTSLCRSEAYFHEFGCSWILIDEILHDESITHINDPAYTQPICTAIQIALVDLFQSWGSRPTAVVGHSSGEIAAAYCVGGLSHRSACQVAFFRGHYVAQLAASGSHRGAMLAVGLSDADIIQPLRKLDPRGGISSVNVGCFNSPKSLTLSGDADQIDEMHQLLDKHKIFNRKLKVDVAYHSMYMNAIANSYASSISDLEGGAVLPANCTMVSSVTGQKISHRTLTEGAYWVDNMTSPVRFSDAMSQICSPANTKMKRKLGAHRAMESLDDILEIGPSNTLQRPVKEILESLSKENIRYSSALVRSVPASQSVLQTFGNFYCLGYEVDISRINQPSPCSNAQSRRVLPDLPEYPFDHSRKYWHESRLSKEGFRLREHPRLDLLGTPVSDWNTLEPRWRKIHRRSEAPWVEDHKVNGTVIYPAAGFIAMALEAAKLMDKDNRLISGYKVRDAEFHTALTIPENGSDLETQLSLRLFEDSMQKDTTASEFRVYAYVEGRWRSLCRGRVEVEHRLSSKVDFESSKSIALEEQRAHVAHTLDAQYPISQGDFYKQVEQTGLTYGPNFQVLDDLFHDNQGGAVGKVHVFRWIAKDNSNHPQPHTVHPTTLDGVFQLMTLALSKGRKEQMTTMMATRVGKLWISNPGISYPSLETVDVQAQAEFVGNRRAYGTMSAVHPISKEILLEIEGFESTSVASLDSSVQQYYNPRNLCYEFTTRPDLNLLSSQQLSLHCEVARPVRVPAKDFYKDLGFMLLLFAVEALHSLAQEQQEAPNNHLRQYTNFLQHKIDLFSTEKLPFLSSYDPTWARLNSDSAYREEVLQKLESSVQGAFFMRIGKNLPKVISGSLDPLSFMYQDDFVTNFYREVNDKVICYEPFNRYIELLMHKSPELKILEIGAGTGATTDYIMRAFGIEDDVGNRAPGFSQYDYTDISPAFFGTASERFARQGDKMSFRVLNIEEDPSSQGFVGGTYDLIFAASVLHATRELDTTMRNVRKLMKPGGKLVLWEVTQDVFRAGFSFGILPGWWLANEENRRWGPCVTSAEWHSLMLRTGFSGIDLQIPDYIEEICHEYSIMVTTAVEQRSTESFDPLLDRLHISEVLLIANLNSYFQRETANTIKQNLCNRTTKRCTVVSAETCQSAERLDEVFCIVLPEIEEPYLSNLGSEAFSYLQNVLTTAVGVLWVTSGGGRSFKEPKFHLVDGLARVARSEFNSHIFITLALENALRNGNGAIEKILQVLENTLRTPVLENDLEYNEIEGVLHTDRLDQSWDLNQGIMDKIRPTRRLLQKFRQHPPLALQVSAPGLLSSLDFVEDTTRTEQLAVGEIEIRVEYSGINFRDCLVALGQIDSDGLGFECAGTVTKVGADCQFAPGDRVTGCGVKTLRTFARLESVCTAKIPDGMSSAEASGVPIIFATAWYALFYVAKLQRGETILIHAGAGGTGQAAIQIAQHFDAVIFTTVSSEEKKELLIKNYNIPRSHIFYSRNTEFTQGIMNVTNKRGVDVILNSLSGEGLLASWECIAPFGRFIEIGKRDINARNSLPMWQFGKHASFTAIDLSYTLQERPSVVSESLQAVMSLLATKKLRLPQPFRTFKISKIEEALRYLQSGQNSGKVVVEMDPEDQIEAILENKPEYYFDSNATYVIAGGLGGLGRSAARWLATRGARNLILLSRSGPKTERAIALLQELEAMGVQVRAPPCDVAVVASLSAALASYAKTMPPIKGVIQGAVAWRDVLLDKMTLEDWQVSLDPKVNGSWNLHTLLPTGMDFFICLSSIAGITGNVGQANYAAGNTYMDALVRYRHSLGEKATALNLGWMESEGIVAEKFALVETFEAAGWLTPITPQEFHALLDRYCNPNLESSCSQVVTGLEPPAVLRQKNIPEPHWMKLAPYRQLRRIGEGARSNTSSEETIDYLALFQAANSLNAAAGVVTQGLLGRLSRALGISVEDVDVCKPLHAYGVDSLLAVELRNYFAKEFDADVPIFDLMGGSTIEQACLVVAGKSKYRKACWLET